MLFVRLSRGYIAAENKNPEKPRAENIRPWVANFEVLLRYYGCANFLPDLIAVSLDPPDRYPVRVATDALLMTEYPRTLSSLANCTMFALFLGHSARF